MPDGVFCRTGFATPSETLFCRTGFATPSETLISGDPENISHGVANPVRHLYFLPDGVCNPVRNIDQR
ncbi:Uncharacterized protein dnm_021050 [Desulfonema magnum]|uniref:Uncharacterized protein n=1 Tax=Desulfonema magnum TaxID=45655 RepID=A0A975BIP5_9BACT|nr:Uncharacterized protein dnm_021050 [Desulfonema magnum]